MIIYGDENVSPNLIRGLSVLQDRLQDDDGVELQVKSLVDVFGRGALDEEWIPKLGLQSAMALTHDVNIKRRRQQFALLAQHGVGVVFIKRPSKKSRYWDTVVQVVRAWPEVRLLVKSAEQTSTLLIEVPASGRAKVIR